jgi:hypothetical protein
MPRILGLTPMSRSLTLSDGLAEACLLPRFLSGSHLPNGEIAMEWKVERVFEDLESHIIAGLANSVVMEYEVRDLIFADDGNGSPYKFRSEDGDLTSDATKAEILVKGTIKWDGCSHNNFGDENGYIHACSRSEIVRLGEMFNRLFDIAQELMPGHGDYLG